MGNLGWEKGRGQTLKREKERELKGLKQGWILGSTEDHGGLINYFNRISMVIAAKVHLDLTQQISDECQVSVVHIQLMNSTYPEIAFVLGNHYQIA